MSNYDSISQTLQEVYESTLIANPTVFGFLYDGLFQDMPLDANTRVIHYYDFDLVYDDELQTVDQRFQTVNPSSGKLDRRLMLNRAVADATISDEFIDAVNGGVHLQKDFFTKNVERIGKKVSNTQNQQIRNTFFSDASVLTGTNTNMTAPTTEQLGATNTISYDDETILSGDYITNTGDADHALHPDKILAAIENIFRDEYENNDSGPYYLSVTPKMLRTYMAGRDGSGNRYFQDTDFVQASGPSPITGTPSQPGRRVSQELSGYQLVFVIDPKIKVAQGATNNSTTWGVPIWQPRCMAMGKSPMRVRQEMVQATMDSRRLIAGCHIGSVRGPLNGIAKIEVRG